MLLENLDNNGDGGVDGVGYDQDESLGRGGRDTSGKITDDTCINLGQRW